MNNGERPKHLKSEHIFKPTQQCNLKLKLFHYRYSVESNTFFANIRYEKTSRAMDTVRLYKYIHICIFIQ